jgi:hypothetical protein
VIEALRGADIRADEAYPGRRIPTLTGAVAAVRLGKVDRSVRRTAVQVVIMSPSADGGSACERTALRAVEALQNMGGSCVKDVCRFDEMANVFYSEIEAAFFGSPEESGWSAGPGYAVKINAQPMEHTVSFAAERKTDNEVTAIANARWEFTLEELLPPGTGEPPDPAEPFTVTVMRSSGQESFTECTLISVKREETIRGVTQIRKGTAKGRNVMGIL